MAIDRNNYFDMPLWSETFGICLMFVIDEDVYKSNFELFFYEDLYQEIRNRKRQLRADAVAGVIPFKCNGDEFYYTPRELTEWAIFRGLPVPHELRKLLDEHKKTREAARLAIEKLEPQAEAFGDAGTGSQAATEPASAKVIQSDSNKLSLSDLLNIPKKIDNWFQVVDDMTRDFYNQNKKIPNETQAWGLLWTNPPDGYAITTSKDKGKEDCLVMPGVNPLSKSAFSKRWKNYSAKKAQ